LILNTQFPKIPNCSNITQNRTTTSKTNQPEPSFKSTRKTAKQVQQANRPTLRSAERDIIDAKPTTTKNTKNQALSPKINPREQRLHNETAKQSTHKTERGTHIQMGKTYSKPKPNKTDKQVKK
jgi:hypothetical protein